LLLYIVFGVHDKALAIGAQQGWPLWAEVGEEKDFNIYLLFLIAQIYFKWQKM